jgi:hypothetical protein
MDGFVKKKILIKKLQVWFTPPHFDLIVLYQSSVTFLGLNLKIYIINSHTIYLNKLCSP